MSPNTFRTTESRIIVITGAMLMLDLLFLSDGLRVTDKFLCGSSSFLVVYKLCGDAIVLDVLVSCACMSSMLAWMGWVVCLRGWRASLGDVGGVYA